MLNEMGAMAMECAAVTKELAVVVAKPPRRPKRSDQRAAGGGPSLGSTRSGEGKGVALLEAWLFCFILFPSLFYYYFFLIPSGQGIDSGRRSRVLKSPCISFHSTDSNLCIIG